MFLSESATNIRCAIIYVVMTLAVAYLPGKSNTCGACSHFKRVPKVFYQRRDQLILYVITGTLMLTATLIQYVVRGTL